MIARGHVRARSGDDARPTGAARAARSAMAVFSAPGGWRVEVVDLDLTRPRRSRTDSAQGARFLIRRYGWFVAFAATVQELAEYLDVATLRRAEPA